MTLFFQAVQILYWLVLATWLGSMVFLAAGAPVVFRTIQNLGVRVPRYSSHNLTDQQGTIVAGEIVGSLLNRLAQIQIICAVAMLPLMIAQFLISDLAGSNLTAAVIRVILWAAAVAITVYEAWVHYPRTWQLREFYLEHADEPEIANPAKEQFDHEHHRSVQLYQVTVFILIGLVMFSANITPRVRAHAPAMPAGVASPQ